MLIGSRNHQLLFLSPAFILSETLLVGFYSTMYFLPIFESAHISHILIEYASTEFINKQQEIEILSTAHSRQL